MAESLPPGLYVVAVPIGNATDISERARDVLSRAAVVACEDTRVTGALFQRLGIRAALRAYHDHNAERARPGLLAALDRGEAVALVSDAGTPLVADPGYRLVQACIEAGHRVVPVPGASALLPALIGSGLPPDRFFFGGFLPPRQTARRKALGQLAAVPATLVFYEAPQRLDACLEDLRAVLGDRPAAVARELTKRYEEFRRGSLGSLIEDFGRDPARGEVVIVIAGPRGGASEVAAEDLDQALRDALTGASVRDAATKVAAATGLPRRRIYERAVALVERARAEGADSIQADRPPDSTDPTDRSAD